MKKAFVEKLAAAIDDVGAGEKELASVLRQIRIAPRAEKTTITKALKDALSKLKLARQNLIDLQKLVAPKK